MIYSIIFTVLLIPTTYITMQVIRKLPLILNLIKNEEIKQQELAKIKDNDLINKKYLEELELKEKKEEKEQLRYINSKLQTCNSYNNDKMENFRDSDKISDISSSYKLSRMNLSEELMHKIRIRENLERYDEVNKNIELEIYKDFVLQQENILKERQARYYQETVNFFKLNKNLI